MCAWCSGGIATPNSVGQTWVSIGAVCVCDAVIASRAGSIFAFAARRPATSRVISAGIPRLSTVITTAGPPAPPPIASALAQIFWVTPSDSARLNPNPLSRTGYPGVTSTAAAPTLNSPPPAAGAPTSTSKPIMSTRISLKYYCNRATTALPTRLSPPVALLKKQGSRPPASRQMSTPPKGGSRPHVPVGRPTQAHARPPMMPPARRPNIGAALIPLQLCPDLFTPTVR
jgi:hypothetical protein